MTQEEAFKILKMGNNVYLTGPAGSGKTFLLNKFINYLKKNNKGVGVTASTGIAATHIGGITIHSWSGLGIKSDLSKEDMKKLLKRRYIKKRFENTGVLIIDEISMFNSFQFDLLNKICQTFKNNLKPFGGMQIVCSGDFFQLPPIARDNKKAGFITESEVWNDMDIKVCYLEEQYRQKKQEKLYAILNNIRSNKCEEAKRLLNGFSYKKGEMEPVKLYTHNVDVDVINNLELSKIKEKEFIYGMESRGNEKIVGILKNGCLAPETLKLKVGANVMFVKNNFEEGYINGTIGRVVSFNDQNLPIVETLSGRMIKAETATWVIEEENYLKAEIKQLPLRLAWAITVHKSQGMNLDTAEINLSKCFVEGMGYVALSRLRSLEGLNLLGANEMAFRVNEKVLELDEKLKEYSKIVEEDLKEMSFGEIEKKEEEFLGKTQKKSISTYAKTELLVKQKLSINEIAKQRKLNKETIIGHLEKMKEQKKGSALSYLNNLSKEDFENIKLAFGQVNDFKLASVKEILGNKFSYEKIRIARLFLEN
jgi:ATP-dependent exoDNAse (exonuclease V) alpha subunit